MIVEKILRVDCADLIIKTHYAKRWPSISFSYGFFDELGLAGCVTYGTPPSAPLRRGVAGDGYIKHVLELNRLVLRDNFKNDASKLVSASLKLLKMEGNFIVISFADTSQGHRGVVYQASGFGYHGLSAKRTDWKVKGLEHLHGQTIADEFRGVKNRAEAMREKYGDDFYLADRPRKHRYIKIVGSKGFRAKAVRSIKYKMEKAP